MNLHTEKPNAKPGDIDEQTGEKYTDPLTFSKMFFMFILLVVVSQFFYNSITSTIKHFKGGKELGYHTLWICTIVFFVIFVVLERYVVRKPFKSFY